MRTAGPPDSFAPAEPVPVSESRHCAATFALTPAISYDIPSIMYYGVTEAHS
jgi:hypothetical protein